MDWRLNPVALSLISQAFQSNQTSKGVLKLKVVAPTKIDDHFVWLTGDDAKYLKQFPERSGQDKLLRKTVSTETR
jgi:hypothetical protein